VSIYAVDAGVHIDADTQVGNATPVDSPAMRSSSGVVARP
jgi:hypothetical protein